MSYNNEDPDKSARRHKPAIIAIVAMLALVLVITLVMRPGTEPTEETGIATTAPPEGTPVEDAEGNGDEPTPTVTPEDGVPDADDAAPEGQSDAQN
ncbi:hypothetical protein Q4511_05050 [Paracoccus sp. 1_MG-2023]|uniref:hypothetical protein n=1 Tax=unclassified Paracoccus (in: a-proteobacteria) TaxID=2688777 RepID=UPI001C08DDA9|nr:MULTISPECIES: hypothetical protein [unclassified Paracoccus (in: a-proteobacteria)]MBU2958157.1 hypothetical protein [Paracoccus sp. C2R09]MDO6668284.1 hypothetical protein [Paracoccus sp. 1_MG-2023]